ncbi:hypothetical protein [Sulfobacillus thermosulfidooxidans]|uniref:hypothetical protein n=1 Tax=Sulfobacillus thermosulfidooxidans TaxID=28034 RepID=UPI0006B5E76B|nr:hypothetical protein [Sulfobacillus thermosulfidooxidans]
MRVLKTPTAVWITYIAFSLVELWLAIHFRENDVGEYHRYALLALTPPLLHHWPKEYPAMSQFIFLLPLLLPFSYRFSFALLTLVALALLLSKGMKRYGTQWGIRVLGYLSLGTIGLFSERYDIFAALFGFLAIDQALQKHWSWAWTFSVIGFLLKLFPAVFWPVFLIAEWRETRRIRWDRLVLSLLAGLAMVGFQALLASHQAFTSYRYLLNRPVEIGSLAASLTALLSHPHLFYAFGSVDVKAHGLAHIIGDTLTVVGIISWLAVFWAQWRGSLDMVEAAILTLGILLLTTKVFSAQYLIWLAPIIALKPGNLSFVLAYLLTSLGYPVGYAIPGLFPWVIYIFAARNLLLTSGFVLFVWRQIHFVSSTMLKQSLTR